MIRSLLPQSRHLFSATLPSLLESVSGVRLLSSAPTASAQVDRVQNAALFTSLCDIVGVENVSKAAPIRQQYGKDESHFT